MTQSNQQTPQILDWKLIKKSTPKVLLDAYAPATILLTFQEVKSVANVADAARDRLRDHIKEHIESGQYDNVILARREGAERAYANSDGLHYLQNGLIIDADKQIPPGKEITVRDSEGHVIARGRVVSNADLYTTGGSTTLVITELPSL